MPGMDPLWVYNRAIYLTISVIFTLILCLQIYVSRRNGLWEVKHMVHYVALLSTVSLMISAIDFGVFNLMPRLAVNFLSIIGGECLLVLACIVIYCHFRAHYLSLKKDVPRHISRILVLTIILGAVFVFVYQILCSQINQQRWNLINIVSGLIQTGVITALDMVGYYHIRKLLLSVMALSVNQPQPQKEGKTHEEPMEESRQAIKTSSATDVSPPPSPLKRPLTPRLHTQTTQSNVHSHAHTQSNLHSPSHARQPTGVSQSLHQHQQHQHQQKEHDSHEGGRVDYEALLKRMFRFHFIVGFLCTVEWIVYFMNIASTLPEASAPIVYPTPQTYTFNYDYHATLVGNILFVWWGWLPVQRKSAGSRTTSSSHVATQASNLQKHSHRSKSEGGPGYYDVVRSASPSLPDSPSKGDLHALDVKEKQPLFDDPLASSTITIPTPISSSSSGSQDMMSTSSTSREMLIIPPSPDVDSPGGDDPTTTPLEFSTCPLQDTNPIFEKEEENLSPPSPSAGGSHPTNKSNPVLEMSKLNE